MHALRKSEAALEPTQEELARTRSGLAETDKQIDALMETLTSASVTPALMQLVNERAHELKLQREALRADQRRLLARLAPMENQPDARALRGVLCDFATLTQSAEPTQIQRLLHLMVRRITWNSNGRHCLQLYKLPDLRQKHENIEGEPQKEMSNPLTPVDANRFDISRWKSCPCRIRTSDPPINSRLLYR